MSLLVPRGLWTACVAVASWNAPGAPVAASFQDSGPLVVFNAGSLAAPFKDLLRAFVKEYPGVTPRQESSGSLEAARKLTDLGRIPDVLAVADHRLIPTFLVPAHATWHVTFARNAMALLYSPRSLGATEVGPENWWRILQRPGVRVGRSDPALDPNGYRTLMLYQLAERHYREPDLSARLLAASPARYVRPKEADLVALVQAGELDYAWSYRSIAKTVGLPFVALPREVDLSDPALADHYAVAEVHLPGRNGKEGITLRGEPIVYALTIPTSAPHPKAAGAFVRFLFLPEGQAILRRHGFTLLDQPLVSGPGRPPLTIPPRVLP
jgi:molybdate/tungstate transport system substrate-binding protein